MSITLSEQMVLHQLRASTEKGNNSLAGWLATDPSEAARLAAARILAAGLLSYLNRARERALDPQLHNAVDCIARGLQELE